MAIARVELPDGRIATIEIPDGMGMEEASAELQSMYDTQPDLFQAPQQAEPQGLIGRAEELAGQYLPPYAVGKGLVTGATDSGLQTYGAGVRESLEAIPRGFRQAFNKITGDDAELAELNQQEEAARADWKQRSAESPVWGGAGKLVGAAGPAIAAGAALPAVAPGAATLGVLGRMGLGAASGGLSGFTQPLTAKEETGSKRTSNAISGAAIGGLVPGATAGAGKLVRALRKVDADDAIADFTSTRLRTQPSGPASAYEDFISGVDDAKAAAQSKYNQLYTAAESVPAPPVRLTNASGLSDDVLSLPNEVAAGLSPGTRRIADALRKGSTRTSPILDSTGKQIADPRNVSFHDAREALRELKALRRTVPREDMALARRLDSIVKTLDDDVKAWAGSSEQAGKILAEAKKVDAGYAKDVVPFNSKNNALGRFLRGNIQDEAAVKKNFLGEDAGIAAKKVIAKVGGKAKDQLRELYGSELTKPRGSTTQARVTGSGTLGEALLDPAERAYLQTVAKSIGDAPKSTGGLSPSIEGILRGMGGEKINTMLHGVNKFSDVPKRSSILADMLRAYGASAAATGE